MVTVPALPSTVTIAPSGMMSVPSATETTHGNAELARHDHRVAAHRADVDDHRRGGHEQRHPRRIGLGCDQHVARLEPFRVAGIEHDARSTRGHAARAECALEHRAGLRLGDLLAVSVGHLVESRDAPVHDEHRLVVEQSLVLQPALAITSRNDSGSARSWSSSASVTMNTCSTSAMTPRSSSRRPYS